MTTPEIVNHMLCSFVGTVSFALIYNVPKKYYFACGITGMAGWLTYLFISSQKYMSASVASFFGALVVVLISRILTVYMKCPITVFLISGILPLVPGAGVYYTAYYIVTNQLTQASLKGIESLKIAFAIVMGIVVVVSIPRELFHLVFCRRKYRKSDEKIEAPK